MYKGRSRPLSRLLIDLFFRRFPGFVDLVVNHFFVVLP